MKLLHVGLLAFCATVAIGIAVIVTKLPTAEVAKPPIPPVALTAQPTPDPPVASPLPVKRRRTKTKSFARQTGAVPFHPATGSFASGGIFSGSDPNDPRIYHWK